MRKTNAPRLGSGSGAGLPRLGMPVILVHRSIPRLGTLFVFDLVLVLAKSVGSVGVAQGPRLGPEMLTDVPVLGALGIHGLGVAALRPDLGDRVCGSLRGKARTVSV